MSDEIISYEPATGAVLWRHPIGDVDAEVACAHAGWSSWASKPLAFRIETMRRFANIVRQRNDAFTDLIARETGKPIWEARGEVETVIAKVDISVSAYADRTAQRRLEATMGSRIAVRHKPHGVLAVLGPYNFPAHLPNGHIVPALIAGNAVVFKPSEKTPAVGSFLVECFRAAGVPPECIRLVIGGPNEGKALAEPLLAEVNRLIDRLIVGSPHDDPAPFMGPVIDNDTADQLTESFLALMMKGGRPVQHMARPVEDRPFVTPGIIDVTDVGDRPDIELFGPLLQVIRADDFDGAIAEANNTRYGLSASLISQTPALFDRFWAGARAGIVNWNRPTNGAPSNAPFGGVGWSGNHRPSAYYAADYCAYPVVSNEAEAARATIGIGLADA